MQELAFREAAGGLQARRLRHHRARDITEGALYFLSYHNGNL